MAGFKVLTRTEITNDYAAISLNEYQTDLPLNKEQIISSFLKPGNFRHEDFHKIARLNKEAGLNYLDHALNLEQIHLSDFKKYTKAETLEFFDKALLKDLALKAGSDERHLFDKLISIITSAESDAYYVISRDFFDTNLPYEVYFEDHKLLYDAIIYEAYYLLIWFDAKDILNVCEYVSDETYGRE